MKVLTAIVLGMATISVLAVTPTTEKKQDVKPSEPTEAKQEMKLSDIPSITTPDRTPNACVDCHKVYPEMKFDGRLSTVIAGWKVKPDLKILEKARAAAPIGKTITGEHPDIKALVKTIPDDCLMCHVRDSRVAPPFAKLLHEIHLVGGKENHFLTLANGTCTSCHKLDQKTGTWRLGSGIEK